MSRPTHSIANYYATTTICNNYYLQQQQFATTTICNNNLQQQQFATTITCNNNSIFCCIQERQGTAEEHVKQLEQSLEEKISEMSRVSQRLKAGPDSIKKK
jgi:hypothetical protein